MSMMLTSNKELRPDVRARRPRLPGARFLEECGGKQGGSRGNLFRGVGSPMLKPPDVGFHKHRGHQNWHKLIWEGVDGPRARVRSVRKAPTLADQARKRRTHLPHKPGAALAAKQRSIEPFVLGNMLEELHPDLCRMLLPQIFDCAWQSTHGFLKDLLHQVV